MRQIKTNIFFVFIVYLAVFFTFPAALFAEEKSKIDDKALTLLDCYNLALNQMETIAIDAQRIKEAEAHFLQALSIVMPHVSFASSDTYINKDSSSSSGSSFSGPHIYERNFVFQQTLFSGFKELAAVKGSKFEKQQRSKEKERAEQLLFSDVSDSFYLFLQEQEDLKALASIEKALTDRIQELNKRIDLGRSRKSEVVNVISQLYTIRAEFESVRNQRDLSRELLEFLTGVRIQEVKETNNVLASVKPIEYFAQRAKHRADVEAAENAVGLAKANIIVAKSGYFPTVDLVGNYYVSRNTQPQTSKWDAGLAVTIPIFEGTQVMGDVKLARAAARESELSLQLAGRSSQTDVRETYTSLRYSILRKNVLKKALIAASENYKLQRKDYEFNLVSNLDVLASIQTLLNTKRDLIQATSQAKRMYWQLMVASGATIKDVIE